MRQVPTNKSYLIIGDGRLAQHLHHYLSSFHYPIKTWTRKKSQPLKSLLQQSDLILLAISDDAIEDFYLQNELQGKTCIHFSGKFYHPEILGFHPLMTFSHKLYDCDFYKKINFVGDQPIETFQQIFPQFENSYYQIKKEQKNIYHALCTLSGNGTTLLWDVITKELQNLNIPKEALVPYLLKVFENILLGESGRFTGPWYRNDKTTTSSHLEVLNNTNLEELYKSFYHLSKSVQPLSGAMSEKHSATTSL